jgi:hypothetical protein
LYLDRQDLDKTIKEYDDDTKAIKEELIKICWYMRGGMSYSESHLLTPDERILIGKMIEENLQTTKDSGLPFF